MVIFVFLLAVPFIFPKGWVNIVNEMLIMALAGCALNLMLGYAGLVSFGPAGLYAIGAYTVAILLTRYDLPFVVAMLMAPVMAALVGAVIGWFCVRRTAVYFALLTLTFSQIIWTVIFKWYDFTNGDDGIVNIPIPEYFYDNTHVYYLSLVVVLICIYLIWRIVHSPFGTTLQAIRENPLRTEFIAIPVRTYQLAVFVISSFFLGIAGALFCVFGGGSVFPDYAHWAKSTDMLIICLLGGIYNFMGPIVGTGIYILLSKIIAKSTIYWMFYLGVIVVVLVLFMRNGVAGFVLEKLSKYRNRSDVEMHEGKL